MINNKRLSNVELFYFTAKLGELLTSDGRIVNSYSYEKGTEDLPAPQECVGLRKWTDEEFHDVTVQYMKPWTPEKVYDELVQIFGKDLFSYGAGFLGPGIKYEGKAGKYEISGVLGIHADLYIEDGAIKSKETISYEFFSDSDFKGLVESIKELEGL